MASPEQSPPALTSSGGPTTPNTPKEMCLSNNNSPGALLGALSPLLGDLDMMFPQEDNVDWQQRCKGLESSLLKFRENARRLREALREKVSELEVRAADAEKRAQDAEEKAHLMEQQLAKTGWNEGSPNVPTLGESPVVNDALAEQVEEQKRLRIQDAKQVEAKAAKIKEWVTNKLKELEEQNQHLREQNQKCNEQLELLRTRLVQISQINPRPKQSDRASTEDSSRGSFEERGESDDSLPSSDLHNNSSNHHHQHFNNHSPSIISRHEHNGRRDEVLRRERILPGDSDSDPLYSAVDFSKKKTYTKSAPPRIKLERKRQNVCISTISSTSTEMGDSVASDLNGKSSKPESNSSTLEGGSTTMNGPSSVECPQHSPSHHNLVLDGRKKPVPPPRTRVNGKLRQEGLNSPRSNSPHKSSASPGNSRQPRLNNVNIGTKQNLISSDGYGSLDRKLTNQRKLHLSELRGGSERRRTAQASNDIHDYAEIYTPNKEVPNLFSSYGDLANDVHRKPPTPPLHRFPSWESKIYEVAMNGINISQDSICPPTGSPNNNSKPTNDSYASGAFSDLNVPVYATVKGRASQIRSMPFTGDSSDSSDNEDTRVTVTTTSSHTTSGETESSASTESPSKKTGSSPSPAQNKQGCLSPMKPVRRDISVESTLSDDYAIPPDAMSSDGLSIDSIEPHILRNNIITDSPKKESLEKSGYLTKLGGKFKTWRRRWFVLKNGTLSYYKSHSDVNRKPQGQIILNDVCHVTRAEGAATFEISTGKRTYYLTADSSSTMEEWVKVLQNVLRRNATQLLCKEENKPAIEGWVTKVKHGHSRSCWGVLVGRVFLYFKTPNEMTALGQINMRDARVEEVAHVSDSDDEDHEDSSNSEYTIGIFPNYQGPTYLILSSRQEMETWLYHLTVVSSGENFVGTQYEQLVAKLMEADGDENSVIWKHPLLLYSKENISHPLTTLPSEHLQNEAVKLFKSIQLFISVPLETSGIDYHVALTQNALQQCLTLPELQNELLCQLIKQTSRHSHTKLGVQQLLLCATQSLFLCDTSSATEKASPTSSNAPERTPVMDSKLNPPPFVFVQGWQLLALAVSLFIPKNRTLWYLRTHLHRSADSTTETGKYAIFCQRALERTLANGERECKPSRMEVLSILLKNPYHHSLPHSIPVHFLNGTYQVAGFDGSTTTEEFTQTINNEAGIRDCSQSGFALFSDDPIEKSIEHSIPNNSKICDVISRWEQALREKHLGKFENTRVIKLTYKNRLHFRQSMKAETEKERLLSVYYINDEITQGRFPLNRELAIELAALIAQIEFGDINSEKMKNSSGVPTNNAQHHIQVVTEKFFPSRFRDPKTDKKLIETLKEKWLALKGKYTADCVRIYLNCSRKWSYCCAKLFSAKLKTGDQSNVWLAVMEDGVTLLDFQTMQQALGRYSYGMVLTFGGCRDDFMLVVASSSHGSSDESSSATDRLMFSMPKPKILEITLLIADYMNALGRTTTLPSSPQASTLSRLEKIRAKIRGTATSTLASTNSMLCSVPTSVCADTPDDLKKRVGSEST